MQVNNSKFKKDKTLEMEIDKNLTVKVWSLMLRNQKK